MKNTNMKALLELLPNEVKSCRMFLSEMLEKLEKLSLDIKRWESAEMQDIASTLDEKGKPLYSNAEKRQAELEDRKANDDYIQSLEHQCASLKKDIETHKIELQFKIDKQENIRAIARLGGGAE